MTTGLGAIPAPQDEVPSGRYAQGGRSPIAYVYLCPPCGVCRADPDDRHPSGPPVQPVCARAAGPT